MSKIGMLQVTSLMAINSEFDKNRRKEEKYLLQESLPYNMGLIFVSRHSTSYNCCAQNLVSMDLVLGELALGALCWRGMDPLFCIDSL